MSEINTFLGIPFVAWGAACLLMALVWCFIWPRKLATANTSPIRRFALRWSHAIVWLLLAAAAFVAGFGVMGGALAQTLALLALFVYVAFLFAVFTSRAKSK
jgi:hypothetical protein